MVQCSKDDFNINIYCFKLNSTAVLITYVEAKEGNSDLLEYPFANDFLELLNYPIFMFMNLTLAINFN
jgi:hypothetical protein